MISNIQLLHIISKNKTVTNVNEKNQEDKFLSDKTKLPMFIYLSVIHTIIVLLFFIIAR